MSKCLGISLVGTACQGTRKFTCNPLTGMPMGVWLSERQPLNSNRGSYSSTDCTVYQHLSLTLKSQNSYNAPCVENRRLNLELSPHRLEMRNVLHWDFQCFHQAEIMYNWWGWHTFPCSTRQALDFSCPAVTRHIIWSSYSSPVTAWLTIITIIIISNSTPKLTCLVRDLFFYVFIVTKP